MEQMEIISGFSELKDLLIRMHHMKKDREFIRLYFSETNNMLLMHDYSDHKNAIVLCKSLMLKQVSGELTYVAHRLVLESLKHASPSEFLINNYQLYGFFRN